MREPAAVISAIIVSDRRGDRTDAKSTSAPSMTSTLPDARRTPIPNVTASIMEEKRSIMDFVISMVVSPVVPACSEPTMVMDPTQNSRVAVTNPFATSPSPFLEKRSSTFFPRRLRAPSMSRSVPVSTPRMVEMRRTSRFRLSKAP